MAFTTAAAVAALSACGEANRNFASAGGSAGASAGGAKSSGGRASADGGSTIGSGGVAGSLTSGGTSESGGNGPVISGGSAGASDSAGAGGIDSAGAGGTEQGGRGEGGDAQGGTPTTGGTGAGGTGAGGSPANSFRGGPCAVSPDKQNVEVFARGRDSNIYRAVVGTTTPKWERLADLDGSLIDNRSDLDCSATTTAVHLVALGRTPPNSFLHATGSGTSYNPFERDLTDYTLGSTPSVFQGFQTILAGTDTVSGTFVFSRTPEGVTSDERDGRIILFSSGIDAWWTTFAMTDVQFFAGFTTAGTLSVQMLQRHVGGQTWRTPASQRANIRIFTNCMWLVFSGDEPAERIGGLDSRGRRPSLACKRGWRRPAVLGVGKDVEQPRFVGTGLHGDDHDDRWLSARRCALANRNRARRPRHDRRFHDDGFGSVLSIFRHARLRSARPAEPWSVWVS